MNPYIGQIILVGFNFAPKGWALCDGRLMSISQNTALFSVLGTTYGGDGKTTFALPDYRGRIAVGKTNYGEQNSTPESPIEQGESNNGTHTEPSKDANKHVVTPPGLGLNYIIALNGVYPPRG